MTIDAAQIVVAKAVINGCVPLPSVVQLTTLGGVHDGLDERSYSGAS
jgi:hypothetical protein